MKNLLMILSLGLMVQLNSQVKLVVKEKISLSDILREPTATMEAEKAASRFDLTRAQKSMWKSAAAQRRELNKPYIKRLEDSLSPDEERSVRLQIRRNQDNFYERITDELTPLQLREFDLERNALLRRPEIKDSINSKKLKEE